jgi:CheY-like chemotaxis protein
MNISEAAILLVDDEPQLLEIFGFWLATAGCRNLHTAADGEAALAVLQTIHVDLLITDIRMPIMDGITLVRQLGRMVTQIPSVVFVSGFADVDQREMYDLGVQAFLAKPLPREDFIAVLEKALADRTSLWLTPMRIPPRQSVLIQAKPNGEAEDEDFVQWGRGGFSARYRGPAKLGKVAFICRFLAEKRDMVGEGYVRWFSRTDQTIGIELAFLDSTCRSWVLEKLTTLNPRSFIPTFMEEGSIPHFEAGAQVLNRSKPSVSRRSDN